MPTGWHIVNYVYGIAVLRPNTTQSLSLPKESKIPGISYLLYNRNGRFKQLRIFGEDNKPKVDIDYHNKDGKMSLHKHVYVDCVRQREHIYLTRDEQQNYSKFVEKVLENCKE